ncbi:Monoterpene epsilon-lactone hydrolase [bacterium HR29]|jgi:monoterpene epsilon-lactone hydrolase|nr:Monoterpene epsilon-lactone hydrolase [bacterium HR29]
MPSQELQSIIAMLRSRPATGPATTPQELREEFERLASMNPVPPDVRVERAEIAGVPCEWLSPPDTAEGAVLLYLHGGGYVIGSASTHRELAARIGRAAGMKALVLDYRLAPEHPFPAAVEDASQAYRWLIEHGFSPNRLAIGGDSAGGGLAVATLVKVRDEGLPMPAAVVLLSPWTDLACTGASLTERAALDPLFEREPLARMAALYLAGADARNPLASPLYADLRGLPPMLIQVGTWEALYDDSARLAERAQAAGVETAFEPWDEAIHAWQLFAAVPEAREATERIGGFLRERLAAARR